MPTSTSLLQSWEKLVSQEGLGGVRLLRQSLLRASTREKELIGQIEESLERELGERVASTATQSAWLDANEVLFALTDSREDVRLGALAECTNRIDRLPDDDSLFRAIAAATRDESSRVKSSARKLLLALPIVPDAVVQSFVDDLRRKEAKERVVAVTMLRRLCPTNPQAVEVFRAARSDPDRNVRAQAERALAN